MPHPTFHHHAVSCCPKQAVRRLLAENKDCILCSPLSVVSTDTSLWTGRRVRQASADDQDSYQPQHRNLPLSFPNRRHPFGTFDGTKAIIIMFHCNAHLQQNSPIYGLDWLVLLLLLLLLLTDHQWTACYFLSVVMSIFYLL